MIVKIISLCRCCFTNYIDFLPRYQKLLRLWIGTAVNYASTATEMQLNVIWSKVYLPPMRFIYFIIDVLIGKLSKLFVSTTSAVADDILRAPWWLFWSFLIPISFDSQDLSLFSFHCCGYRRDYSSALVWFMFSALPIFRLSHFCFPSDFD